MEHFLKLSVACPMLMSGVHDMKTENDSPGVNWRQVRVLWASLLPVLVMGLKTVCANRTVPADRAIHIPKLPLGPVQIPRMEALMSKVSECQRGAVGKGLVVPHSQTARWKGVSDHSVELDTTILLIDRLHA